MTPPDNHYGLESKQKLLETLQNDITVYEAKFEPLDKQFSLLEKYEQPVPETVSRYSVFQGNKKRTVEIFLFLDSSNAFAIARTLGLLSSMFAGQRRNVEEITRKIQIEIIATIRRIQEERQRIGG